MKPIILSSLDLSSIPDIVKKLKKSYKILYSVNSRPLTKKYFGSCNIYLAAASVKVDKDLLNTSKKLKLIISPSTGTDHLDLQEIKKKKIKCVTITKEIKLLNSFTATSELSFSLMLNLFRKILPASKDTLKGVWAREKYSGRQLYGKTIGILGMGRLGKISAKIASGFNMKILAHDIIKKKINHVKMVSLQKLFKSADIVCVHIHLTKKTRGMINKKLIKLMKKSSIIINTSRGAIINEDDLLYALKKKLIAGAGLDVINGEWLSKSELLKHKLIKFAKKNNNLLIVPHIGGSTLESISGARRFVCNKLLKEYKRLKII